MDTDAVLQALSLDDSYRPWVADLGAGPGPQAAGEPWSPESSAALLGPLQVPERLAAAVERSGRAVAASPAWTWLLGRCRQQLLDHMGSDAVQVGPWPVLPAGLGAVADFFYLHVFAAATPDIRAEHRRIGLPDDVSWATLADLGRHVVVDTDVYGHDCLASPGWLQRNWRGILFEVGRLQYEWCHHQAGGLDNGAFSGRADQSTLWHRNGIGEPAVDLHIPAAGPLTPAAVDDSLAGAVDLLPRLQPPRAVEAAVCTSWLLDPQLAEYLPEDSNIMRFQRRFTVVDGTTDGTDEMMRFVFRTLAPTPLESLPQRSTLERAFVGHLRAGRRWHQRSGWFAWPA
jgi:hypothetical protein